MREYLMLAKQFRGESESVQDWFVSHKFDGMRALWDGGVSKGMMPPWCTGDGPCTGLFSRYGRVIKAPDWWLDYLPKGICLDGELYAGSWRDTVSVTRSHAGDWNLVKFHVFDVPTPAQFSTAGIISNAHTVLKVDWDWRQYWEEPWIGGQVYETTAAILHHVANAVVKVIKQTRVNGPVEPLLADALQAGYEGLMFRHPLSTWLPHRTRWLQKYKPTDVSDGVVVGHTSGKGKYAGVLGALVVRWEDHVFSLSGMSDEIRRNPPPVGSKVYFHHTGVTADGVPREARFICSNT